MDNSPTALFDTYEQDFRQILDSVRSKLDGDGKDERGGEDNIHSLPRLINSMHPNRTEKNGPQTSRNGIRRGG